jgi:oxalate decarboxylase
MAHYVENQGQEPLRYLEMFRSTRFVDFSLGQWLGLTPPELVQAHLNLDQQTLAALHKERREGRQKSDDAGREERRGL